MPLHAINYDEPFAHMQFLAASKVVRETIKWDGSGWGDLLEEIGDALDTKTQGNVFVMLGREDDAHFTDDHLEVVVRYDNDADLPVIEEAVRSYQ